MYNRPIKQSRPFTLTMKGETTMPITRKWKRGNKSLVPTDVTAYLMQNVQTFAHTHSKNPEMEILHYQLITTGVLGKILAKNTRDSTQVTNSKRGKTR